MFRGWLLSGCGLALTVIGSNALAQEVDASDTSDEIVVTATKREERLQDVPVSVTAITAERLESLGVESSGDIAAYTPTMQWRSGTGYSRPSVYLRGVGNSAYQMNAGSAVGVYIDGVNLGSNISHPFQLLDLERVEVLRGPQGTLFGRNTTGGLVNFISNRPRAGDPVEGNLQITAGDFGVVEGNGAITVPLGDSAAFRLALSASTNDGYFDGVNPSANGAQFGQADALSGRATLRVQPNPGVDITVSLRHGRTDGTYWPYKQFGLACASPDPALGQCTDAFGFRDSTDFQSTSAQFEGFENSESTGGTIDASFDISPSLTLTSVSAYDSASLDFFGDEDSSPTTQLHDGTRGDVDFFSQELRLTTNFDGPLNFIFGGYYYIENLDSLQFFTLTDFGPGVLTGTSAFGVPEGAAQILSQRTETYAAFASATWDLTERLTARAGARWTYDERDVDVEALIYNSSGAQFLALTTPQVRARSLVTTIPAMNVANDWSEWSGNVSLDYAISDDVMAFVGFARGFKGGEFNGGALFSPAEANLVNPETVDSIELGVKSEWWDGRFRANVTAFHMDYQDQQVFILGLGASVPLQTLSNAGASTSQGVEFEFELRPTDGLTLGLTGAYLNAEFDEFIRDPFNPTGSNLAGNRLAHAPEWTASGFARQQFDLSFGRLSLQADFSHVGDQFYNVVNLPIHDIEARTLFGLRAGLETGPWEMAVWGRNITDEDYFTSGSDVSAFGFYVMKPGLPRTWGVTLSRSF
jgi:iron complex outermembrane recepter protein